jgi:hypothetical protein
MFNYFSQKFGIMAVSDSTSPEGSLTFIASGMVAKKSCEVRAGELEPGSACYSSICLNSLV